jgi:hypothetical protein
MGSMTETFANSDNANILLRTFYKIIHIAIPNFDKFNVTNTLLHPEAHITSMAAYTGQVTLYALLYSLVMMTLAVIIFERKEV